MKFKAECTGHILSAFLATCALLIMSSSSFAQSTVFTYQGRLTDSGTPASGVYDFQLRLFDAGAGGVQVGPTLAFNDVIVTNGIFTVQPDFGNSFPGNSRFLEAAVRPGASTGAYVTLTPLQPIVSTPYSIRSLNSAAADSLSSDCAGCIVNGNLGDGSVTNAKVADVAGSKITGSIPVAGVPAGSPSYIQNGTLQQSGANFNISGNGTAGGALTAGAFNYATAQNGVYIVNEAAFTSRDGTAVVKGFGNGGVSPTANTTGGLLAPINLPDGATVTNVRYIYIDNSANNLSFRVLINYNSGAYNLFGSHTSSVATSSTQIVDVPVSFPVDNSSYSLEVQANSTSTWGDSTMQVRSVILTYTMPRPAR